MQATKALGKCISIITLLMVVSACNQPYLQNPSVTNTPSTGSTATEPPIALTALPESLSLEQELAAISQSQRETVGARTAHNAPSEMQLRKRIKIQLVLNRSLSEEQLKEQVTEPGPVLTGRVEVTSRVKAELISPDSDAFTIVPITEVEQPFGNTETTEWLWYVTANKAGPQTLTIVLSRGVKYDNQIDWIKVATYETNINVTGTTLDRLKSAGWIWIAGIFLTLAAIPAVWRWVRAGKTKTGQAEKPRQESGSSRLPRPSKMGSPGNDDLGHIFMSYRRSDSADIAGRIYDRLVDEFGRNPIFKDVDSIPLGTDFKDYLDRKVSECNVLLAVIGDRWIDASDEKGRKRLDDPQDFVRVEIESALERGIPVIPLLVRSAQMPLEESLPPSLRKLVYKNGIPIRPDPDFHRDMDRLISALDEFIG